jgi:hypothetical protein
MRVLPAFLAMAVAGGAAAWWLTRPAEGGLLAGTVALEWSGSDNGAAVLPGEVHWCPINRTGRLEAISNDTGLMILLYERDSLTAVPHRVLGPEFGADGTPRPGATAAIRWVQDTLRVVGYRAVSGSVEVEGASPTLSGAFNIRMQHPTRVDTLAVRGNFRDLPVTIAAAGCP